MIQWEEQGGESGTGRCSSETSVCLEHALALEYIGDKRYAASTSLIMHVFR